MYRSPGPTRPPSMHFFTHRLFSTCRAHIRRYAACIRTNAHPSLRDTCVPLKRLLSSGHCSKSAHAVSPWQTGMDTFTRWYIRHCLQCEARKTSRQTICWPTLSLPLPNGPGVTVSVDYYGPLPITPRGSVYILIFRPFQTTRQLVRRPHQPVHCRRNC